MTKIPKFPNIQSFYEIFDEFSVDFVDLNFQNAQHGTNSLSSRLFRRYNCRFLGENHLKLTLN